MDKALIGLVGVILGAILTSARELWKENKSRKKRAEYLAIRVSCILDRYVEGCVAVADDDGSCGGGPNADGYYESQVDIPKLEVESLDVDWQALPSDLMYEILSFPSNAEDANHKINSAFECLAGPPYYEEGVLKSVEISMQH